MEINKKWLILFSLVALLVACNGTLNEERSPLIVSAAADLKFAFEELGEVWEGQTGQPITFNFGSTGQLAQQIERGAPVDLFAAANEAFIEELDRQGLILTETKALYALGRITIWTREDSDLELQSLEDLTRPEVQRIAIANPDHAPYGIAAREALQSVGIWEKIQPKLILGDNIRQTQQYAETGNVDVAIVALSLSINQPGKWVLIPEELHNPLSQMLAVPRNAPQPQLAQEFATFINREGRPIMRKYGFVLPGEEN